MIDDGSQDATAAVARDMGATVVSHPHNCGLSAARNTGLSRARHSWVALLDSDDEWLPHHLATVWSLRGDHVLVASSALECGANPAADRFAGPVTRSPIVLHSGAELIYPSNIVRVSTSLFRRELALDIGGFRPHHGVSEDFDMWLRLLERGTAVCSPRVSIIYHVHPGQMSAHARTMELGTIAAAEAHFQRTGSSRVPLKRWEGVAAWDNFRDAIEARKYRRALRHGTNIAAHPQRIVGLLGIWARRYRVRRRSAELRGARVGPTDRRLSTDLPSYPAGDQSAA